MLLRAGRAYWFTMLRPANLKWFECELEGFAAALFWAELREASDEELADEAML